MVAPGYQSLTISPRARLVASRWRAQIPTSFMSAAEKACNDPTFPLVMGFTNRRTRERVGHTWDSAMDNRFLRLPLTRAIRITCWLLSPVTLMDQTKNAVCFDPLMAARLSKKFFTKMKIP